MSARGRGRSPSPHTGQTATSMTPADRVADALRLKREDLALVGQSTLEQAFHELDLSAADRASVEVDIKKGSRCSGLEAHFAEETAQKLYPWKVPQEEAVRLLADLTALHESEEEEETLRQEFIRKAKNGALSEMETVLGAFLLFAPDIETGRRQLLATLLRVPPAKRMAVYNWWIASQLPPTTVTAHGATIRDLRTPMFPPHPSLTYLNEKLWSGVLGGGEMYLGESLWGGEPNLPVQQGSDGNLFVDAGLIQEVTLGLGASLAQQQEQLNRLQQLQSQMNRRQPRQAQPRANYSNNNNNNGGYSNNYNGSYNTHNRGGYNNSNRGGRRGGRGRMWGGEEQQEAQKNE